jgi:multidrug efflux pump subunit AcrA (membrane-fusion protein)
VPLKQYTLSELTDSRLLFDKNPPKFLFLTVAIVLLLLSGTIIASIHIHKPYVVKTSGMVTSTDKTSITVNVQGTIITMNLKEGQNVKVGDTIMTFDDSQTRLQMQQFAEEANYYNNQISLYNQCIKEINSGTNTFNKNDSNQAVFYFQIQLMQSQMAQYTVSDDQYKSEGYTADQIQLQQAQNAAQRNNAKYQTISNLETQREQLEEEKESAGTQRDEYNNLLSEYIVKAPQSGVVHLNASIKPGMILQAGTDIGTISVDAPTDLTVETYVSAQDRSKVNINSSAQIAVSGISQSDYGILDGKITAIDTDATVDQSKGTVYYKAEIKPDKTILKNKNGQTVNLKSGMVTQANIQYEDSTWFNWALEEIGFKTVQ